MLYIKVTWPTGASHIEEVSVFVKNLDAYLTEWEVGDHWEFDVVEMTEEEYAALPEFMGP